MTKLNKSHLPFAIALLAFTLFAWWSHSYNWDLVQAYTGFSPVTYVMQLAHPENFTRDFPLGISITDASSFMHIYKYMYGIFGVHPDITGPIVILLEIILLGGAFIAFANVTQNKFSKTAIFVLLLLVIGSNARDLNLAFFGHPFFEGQYYNAADALRLCAIAAMLLQRYVIAGFLIGLCFTVHPLMALMGGVFMGAIVLATPEKFKDLRLWSGGAIAALIAGLWSVLYLGINSTANAQTIPLEDWFLFTQMTSHWYPIALGGFTTGAPGKLFPFISFFILLLYYMQKRAPLNTIDKGVMYGIGACFLMVVLGLIFSEQRSYPLLVKLCLIRANDLIVMVGLPYIVFGLINDIKKSHWTSATLAFAILVTPFIDQLYAGWHALFTFALITPYLYKQRKSNSIWYGAIAACTVFYILYAAFFATFVPMKQNVLSLFYSDNLTGYYIFPIALAAAFYMLISKKALSSLIIGLTCLTLSFYWLWQDRDYAAPALQKYASDYKDAQIWANQNTSADALFMVEPSIAYGWRAYSERSSFGTPREHYLMSWIYNGDYEAYSEGQKRLKIYTKDIRKTAAENKFPRPIINGDTSMEYNDFSNANFYQNIIDSYDINYFVFDKKKLKTMNEDIQISAPPFLLKSYENENFVIYQTRN